MDSNHHYTATVESFRILRLLPFTGSAPDGPVSYQFDYDSLCRPFSLVLQEIGGMSLNGILTHVITPRLSPHDVLERTTLSEHEIIGVSSIYLYLL